MSREEMIAFTHRLVDGYKDYLIMLYEEGVFKPDEYTWQDWLADYTTVEIETEEEIDTLSDEELKQIVDIYVDDDSDLYDAYKILSIEDLFGMYANANTYDGNCTNEHTTAATILKKRLGYALQRLDESDGSEAEVRKIYCDFIDPS